MGKDYQYYDQNKLETYHTCLKLNNISKEDNTLESIDNFIDSVEYLEFEIEKNSGIPSNRYTTIGEIYID